jgi:serine/threonine protein kinase
MSEVYLAVVAGPAGFNKLVVIKLIKAELAEDPDFISMFLEEARLSARLSHANVVQTNEVGEVGGRYYIAMEYLEGQPYSRILHRLGRDRGLPLGMSLRILSDVLQGLHYAHELGDFDGSALGVVHRDVTPHNVFVTYDGQVKVVDFGIAKAMNSSHETRTGMLKGKVGYMAPEQAKGERVDRRADIFSVGVMLWEAAVGRRLWKGLNEVQILHQLLSGEIPSPRSMRPDISQHLESIIMRALATDRDRRPATAQVLQHELEELMDSGSERSTLREVGRMVSGAFEEERKKLKSIIEQQLAKSAMLATGMYQHAQLPAVDQPPHMTMEAPRANLGGGPSSSIPNIGHAMQHTGSVSGSNPHSHPSYSMSGAALRPAADASGSGHYSVAAMPPPPGSHPGIHGVHGVPSMHGAPTSGSHPGDGHQSHPSVTTGSIARASVSRSGPQSTFYPAQQGGNKNLTLVALVVAAAAGGLAALLYLSVGRKDAAQPPAAASTTTAPAAPTETAKAPPEPSATAAPAPSASENKIAIEVKAKPESAEIFLDSNKIGEAGKASVTIPVDGKEHELKVSAAGYASKTYKIEPNQTKVDWNAELSREKPAAGGGGPVVTPPTAKTNDADKRCAKKGKTGRCVDAQYDP